MGYAYPSVPENPPFIVKVIIDEKAKALRKEEGIRCPLLHSFIVLNALLEGNMLAYIRRKVGIIEGIMGFAVTLRKAQFF